MGCPESSNNLEIELAGIVCDISPDQSVVAGTAQAVAFTTVFSGISKGSLLNATYMASFSADYKTSIAEYSLVNETGVSIIDIRTWNISDPVGGAQLETLLTYPPTSDPVSSEIFARHLRDHPHLVWHVEDYPEDEFGDVLVYNISTNETIPGSPPPPPPPPLPPPPSPPPLHSHLLLRLALLTSPLPPPGPVTRVDHVTFVTRFPLVDVDAFTADPDTFNEFMVLYQEELAKVSTVATAEIMAEGFIESTTRTVA
ncbi:hypothetical protein CYMTET_35200, partial [Cymbomonas tetramitiformis]